MKNLIYPYGILRICPSFRCNGKPCFYCSVRYFQKDLCKVDDYADLEVPLEKWVERLQTLKPNRPLKVIIGSGEPGMYKGLADIVNSIPDYETGVYTNASDAGMAEYEKIIPRRNFYFYVSYHPTSFSRDEWIGNAKRLREKFNIMNFHAVPAPAIKELLVKEKKELAKAGIDLVINHPFSWCEPGNYHFYDRLGELPKFKNRFASRADGVPEKTVLCKTSFNHAQTCNTMVYPVAPNGDVYVCWRYLFNHSKDGILGNFFDGDFEFRDEHYECNHYGDCNLCAWDRNIIDKETGHQLDTDVIAWHCTPPAEKPTISACMIVKNEEEMLDDCLASIEKWTDEIILVDTGSTDKTIEIAKKYGAKIYEQKWLEDFSVHRNFSISKATKDWIFIIDADERVIPGHGENLKNMLPEIKETDVIAIDVYNLYLLEGVRVSRSHFKSLRLFRRSCKPRYEGRIHNRPIIPRGSKVYMLPMRINHFGYDLSQEAMDIKYARTVGMCKRWVKEKPKEREAWFQLARAMKVKQGKLNTEEMPLIMEALQEGIALGDGDDDYNHIHLQMLNLKGWLKYATGEHAEALNYGKRAIAMKPDYIDSILLVGLVYTYGVDALKGEEWLQRYLRSQEAYQYGDRLDGIVMEHANDRILAYKALIDIEGWKEKNHGVKLKEVAE